MNFDELVPAAALIAILILIFPNFLSSNSNNKIFVKNISIWTIIVFTVMIVSYLILK